MGVWWLVLISCTQDTSLGPAGDGRVRDGGAREGDPREGGPGDEPSFASRARLLPERDPADRARRSRLTGGDPGVPGARLYAEGVIHDIALTLDDAAIAALTVAPTAYVPAGFAFGGMSERLEVGVRLKGTSSFRTLDGKPAFKVDFDRLVPDQRFLGLEGLTLNNMVQDPTMLREHLYYWTCGQLGLPAARHGYARVTVNGEDFGLYGVLETMNDQLLERLWPDDAAGPLYEGAGNDFTAERQDFELKEEGEGLVLADLVATVIATPPDAYLAMLDANFDLDALLGYWALDIASGNPDGYAFNHNNFYVYGAPVAGRWTLLPYGVDRAFSFAEGGIHGSDVRVMRSVLVNGCLADEACHVLLDARIRDTADAFDALDLVGVVTGMEAVVGPACEADPRRDRDCRSAEILAFVEGRAEAVREELDRE